MAKEFSWHKVEESNLPISEKDIQVLDVNGKKICCTLYQGQLFAFAYKCPHAGGIMANGFVDAIGNVVCPLHRYKFSLKNGYNSSGEGYYLKTYPMEKREDGWWLGLEKSGWFW